MVCHSFLQGTIFYQALTSKDMLFSHSMELDDAWGPGCPTAGPCLVCRPAQAGGCLSMCCLGGGAKALLELLGVGSTEG